MTMESRRDFFKTATVGALGTAGVLAGVSSTAEARPARAKHDLDHCGRRLRRPRVRRPWPRSWA